MTNKQVENFWDCIALGWQVTWRSVAFAVFILFAPVWGPFWLVGFVSSLFGRRLQQDDSEYYPL